MKLYIVFDASTKSLTGVLLNDQLLVGPMVHAPLVNVLLRFCCFKITLATNISKKHCATLLPQAQHDLHRFVWRRNESDEFKDYWKTRLTFVVSASSFAANMEVKQNAIVHEHSHPWAALAIHCCFYVDDGLTGANSLSKAVELPNELQDLFDKGGFLLRKPKWNEPATLHHLPPHLVDHESYWKLSTDNEYTKVLRVVWNIELN